ncbi:MAG TPA: carboxypeptidase regulatory-like domain-containing protein [Anaeromyxobacteraceae bacterium]|nr:carboxypeptidase regulatory-like domain-containing protein [Anaeromyxobacteraceae bacterium]
MRRFAFLLAVGLAACGELEHKNPYDPGTPPELQARANLAGSVTLEALGDPAPDLSGTLVTVLGVGSVTTDGAGGWTLTDVPPGNYTVRASRAGHDDGYVTGVVVRLDDGGTTLSVPPIRLLVSRGALSGAVTLSPGVVAGFPVGADFSGTVVTLEGAVVPLPAAVTDAAGNYRFDGVPVSAGGASYAVTARRPFFGSASTSAVVVAGSTVAAAPILLEVEPGALSGVATLFDDPFGLGTDNATSAGVDVSVSGTAFNGASWSAAGTTATDGSFLVGPLPPGSYDVVAASPSRACGDLPRVTVPPGGTADAGAARCVDGLAPGAVVLGSPTPPPGADAGYTRDPGVSVPVAAPAVDPTTPDANLRGYEIFVGPVPDWSRATTVGGQPATLAFDGLARNSANVLWVRPVDWVGNAGPTSGTTVVHDDVAPPVPVVSTPRQVVDATTASVTLAGSEADANFDGYETCAVAIAAGAACAASPPAGCTFAPSPAAAVVSLTVGQKTCLFARALDHAGNASGAASIGIVSDLVPPVGPDLAPRFDPTLLTVRGEYVDFFVTAPATDQPAGGGPWQGVAWVEVDSGAGFAPLCPRPECRAGGAWAPCTCSCGDPRLLCRGAEFLGFRVPLLGGTATDVAIRAVDVAGNVGSGASQSVSASASLDLVATTRFDDAAPRTKGRFLVFGTANAAGTSRATKLVDLGPDQTYDVGDTRCDIGLGSGLLTLPSAEPISTRAVAAVDGGGVYAKVRRPGPDGFFCTGDDSVSQLRDVGFSGTSILALAASRDRAGRTERVAWSEITSAWSASTLHVREAGSDGLVGTGDDPADVVFTLTPAALYEVALAGDVLLHRTYSAATGLRWTVVNAGASGFGSGTTTWTVPGAVAAGLASDGSTLAWVANDPAQTIHVRSAGADGRFGTADDTEVSRTYAGSWLSSAGVAVEGAHVVVAESSGSTNYLDHWYAGGDGVFGTADDTFARVLPSSVGRHYPALADGVAGGTVYVQLGQTNVVDENPDLIALDLSALRWEVARDATVSSPRSNRAGTLFFYDETDFLLTARTADGRETKSGYSTSSFEADGSSLFVGKLDGTLWLSRPDAGGQWFTAAAPADAQVSALFQPWGRVVAGGGRVMFDSNQAAYALTLLEPNPTLLTPAAVRLDGTIPGTTHHGSWTMGVSQDHALWVCRDDATYTDYACGRDSVDGRFGNGDDVSLQLVRPGTATRYPYVWSVRVSGNRALVVAWIAPSQRAFVVDAGADRRFNTGDDTETEVATVTEFNLDGYDFAGSMVAWTAAGETGGTQIWLADVDRGTRRQLTSHYAPKPDVFVEPSGRTFWTDLLFSSQAIFVSAP